MCHWGFLTFRVLFITQNSQEVRPVKTLLRDLSGSAEVVANRKSLFEVGDAWNQNSCRIVTCKVRNGRQKCFWGDDANPSDCEIRKATFTPLALGKSGWGPGESQASALDRKSGHADVCCRPQRINHDMIEAQLKTGKVADVFWLILNRWISCTGQLLVFSSWPSSVVVWSRTLMGWRWAWLN